LATAPIDICVIFVESGVPVLYPELYKSFKLSLLNLLPVVVLAANLPS
jgi:hypothetical protein